ncbi:MAG: AbrB/MazE/SpoVT family DNA-binding domain-containing protein [Myxococcaceae bacterium]
MTTATMTSKGQITVPKEVRQFLHLNSGDKLDFIIDREGEIRLKASYVHVSELKGILKQANRKTVTLEEMETSIKAGYQRHHTP